MAHEIDMTTGQAGIAYLAGSGKPWHGLGQTVGPDQSVDEWRVAAGLDWEARRSPVQFENENVNELQIMSDRHVLYRSDTSQALSVVSENYKIVQPNDILQFFSDLAKKNDFQIETVGALKEGRRVWALARVGENSQILDDQVAPYLMLATSYDGSMATIAQYTSVRVVCNNTLQASLQGNSGHNRISIPHSAIFDATRVKSDLRIKLDSWETFKMQATHLAQHKVTDKAADAFLQELLAPLAPVGKSYSPEQFRKTKGYGRIMSLYQGGQKGAQMDATKGTAWGLVNAVTEYVDHEKGRIDDNRLDQAWFGVGAKLKNEAFSIAMKQAA